MIELILLLQPIRRGLSPPLLLRWSTARQSCSIFGTRCALTPQAQLRSALLIWPSSSCIKSISLGLSMPQASFCNFNKGLPAAHPSAHHRLILLAFSTDAPCKCQFQRLPVSLYNCLSPNKSLWEDGRKFSTTREGAVWLTHTIAQHVWEDLGTVQGSSICQSAAWA